MTLATEVFSSYQSVVIFAVFKLLYCVLVDGSKVLLISMDGFRWDYIDQVDTPNFDAFAAYGTKADYINGTFVTKTFPSHFSMVTGEFCYISNKFNV